MARAVFGLGSLKSIAMPAHMSTTDHSSSTSASNIKPLLKEKIERRKKRVKKA
jgi:hypothetical protein